MPDGAAFNVTVFLAHILLITYALICLWLLYRQKQEQQKNEDIFAEINKLSNVLSQLQQDVQNLQKMKSLLQAQELQQTKVLNLIQSLDQKQELHRIEELQRLEVLEQKLDNQLDQLHLSILESVRNLSNPPDDSNHATLSKRERWQQLVQSAIDGEIDALAKIRQALELDSGVRPIDIADIRLYLNNNRYAEFVARSTGDLLLIPLEDEPQQPFIALPYPKEADWFVRNRRMLSRLFIFSGEWTNTNAIVKIGQAAVLRKKTETDSSKDIFEVVERGVLRF